MSRTLRFPLAAALLVAAATVLLRLFPTSPPVARAAAWAMGAEYLGREGTRIQEDDVDCGVAALQMVLEARGVNAPGALDSARAVLRRRGGGASLLELQALARAHGVELRGWQMNAASLAHAPLPAVAHYPDHYVVVDRVLADGTVELRDPGVGRLRMPAPRFAALWSGKVLVLDEPRGHAPLATAAP